ncbi:MAG: bifunctional nuclease family protein [candidate division WOR-3 bacterium]
MSNMVEVVIDSLRASLMSPQRVILLRRTDVEHYLPVWIGPFEAEAIAVALQEVETSRPMTHDLLKSLFAAFHARILRVEIVALREDVFYGNIVAEVNGEIVNIDSRPSDAIALAVRAHVPILVNQAVMNEAGILPERDLQTEEPAPSGSESPTAASANEEGRLDVFEEFLKKLDKGDEEKPTS